MSATHLLTPTHVLNTQPNQHSTSTHGSLSICLHTNPCTLSLPHNHQRLLRSIVWPYPQTLLWLQAAPLGTHHTIHPTTDFVMERSSPHAFALSEALLYLPDRPHLDSTLGTVDHGWVGEAAEGVCIGHLLLKAWVWVLRGVISMPQILEVLLRKIGQRWRDRYLGIYIFGRCHGREDFQLGDNVRSWLAYWISKIISLGFPLETECISQLCSKICAAYMLKKGLHAVIRAKVASPRQNRERVNPFILQFHPSVFHQLLIKTWNLKNKISMQVPTGSLPCSSWVLNLWLDLLSSSCVSAACPTSFSTGGSLDSLWERFGSSQVYYYMMYQDFESLSFSYCSLYWFSRMTDSYVRARSEHSIRLCMKSGKSISVLDLPFTSHFFSPFISLITFSATLNPSIPAGIPQ